ncbi:putative serine dehydratase domain-containing protein [Xylariales sp. PMI_506]|nr:putative serine dehydratase domain-containing protein [Xylariales sp. PMI_506]
MDHSLEHHTSYIGKPASELPTPSLILSLPTIRNNVETLHRDVEKLGIRFRPHVKTLKSIEVTRMMLAGGKYRRVVASTMAEIRGLLPLAQEGILDECLYGLPIIPSYLPQLAEFRKTLRVVLMVDSEQHIDLLEKYNNAAATTPGLQQQKQPWDIFIKLDVGTHRAGVVPGTPALEALVRRAEASPAAVRVYGFYCHAGHSYASRDADEAAATLSVEVESVLAASAMLPADREVVVSIGATPTAHVVGRLQASVPANVKLELHAGNFPCNDLQQVSTGLVLVSDQALRVATEVCSVYPERNEALVNAGVIALSKETSHTYPGFGTVADKPEWHVVRMSQEHGILGRVPGSSAAAAEADFKVGQRVYLHCNHSCITAAAFYVYYVVDENDIVVETWLPWKGW